MNISEETLNNLLRQQRELCLKAYDNAPVLPSTDAKSIREEIQGNREAILNAPSPSLPKPQKEQLPTEDMKDLAYDYAKEYVPNPDRNHAPFYTTADRFDDLFDAWLAGYKAAMKKEQKD